MEIDLTTIRSVLKENRFELLGRSNVVATGIGYKITKGAENPDAFYCLLGGKEVACLELIRPGYGPCDRQQYPHRCGGDRTYPGIAIPYREISSCTRRREHRSPRYHGRHSGLSCQEERADIHPF